MITISYHFRTDMTTHSRISMSLIIELNCLVKITRNDCIDMQLELKVFTILFPLKINLFPLTKRKKKIWFVSMYSIIKVKRTTDMIFSSLSWSRWRIYVVIEGREGRQPFALCRDRGGVGPHPRVPSPRSRPCSSSSQWTQC